ncbi:hypothetical protein AVDCRST_MAG82-325, partial [uncultured Rubrobacteraceae bacterium]
EGSQKDTQALPRTAEDAVRRRALRSLRGARQGAVVFERGVLRAPGRLRHLPHADRRLVRAAAVELRRRLSEDRSSQHRARDGRLDDRDRHP